MEYKFIWNEFDNFLYICKGDFDDDSYRVINHSYIFGIGKKNTHQCEIPNNKLLNILFGLDNA